MDPRRVWESPIKVQEGVGASQRLDEWRSDCGRPAAIQKNKAARAEYDRWTALLRVRPDSGNVRYDIDRSAFATLM